MYENMTFETILARMLSRVPDSLDKREGAVIYDALAPAAAELTQSYIELDAILNETFADTAGRENLIRRASERGIVPGPATKAVFKGEFNREVPLGSRYSLEEFNYTVVERIGECTCKLECETPGRAGNGKTGTLVPISYIDGLTDARLTALLIPGEDEEDTEHLRRRYFDSLSSEAFGGNIRDYREKVNSIPGVGGVKVYPAWNGGGTVRLAIITSEKEAPAPELVQAVQTAIDPVQNQGAGIGIAPIGHVVTVEGVAPAAVDISTEIVYQADWSWEAVKTYAEEAVDEYFSELAGGWADSDSLTVRISQIETRFLGLPGVVDISGTAINGQEQNLVLGPDEIPKRGEISG